MLNLIEVIIDRLKNIDIRVAFIIATIGAICYYETEEPGYVSRTIRSFTETYDDLIAMGVPLCIGALVFVGAAVLILKAVYFIRKLVK